MNLIEDLVNDTNSDHGVGGSTVIHKSISITL